MRNLCPCELGAGVAEWFVADPRQTLLGNDIHPHVVIAVQNDTRQQHLHVVQSEPGKGKLLREQGGQAAAQHEPVAAGDWPVEKHMDPPRPVVHGPARHHVRWASASLASHLDAFHDQSGRSQQAVLVKVSVAGGQIRYQLDLCGTRVEVQRERLRAGCLGFVQACGQAPGIARLGQTVGQIGQLSAIAPRIDKHAHRRLGSLHVRGRIIFQSRVDRDRQPLLRGAGPADLQAWRAKITDSRGSRKYKAGPEGHRVVDVLGQVQLNGLNFAPANTHLGDGLPVVDRNPLQSRIGHQRDPSHQSLHHLQFELRVQHHRPGVHLHPRQLFHVNARVRILVGRLARPGDGERWRGSQLAVEHPACRVDKGGAAGLADAYLGHLQRQLQL